MSPQVDIESLAARESEQVEWKENVADPADVVRTLVAFANDFSNLGGGYVVCGARESQDPHGFQKVELVGLTAARLREVEGRVMSACAQHVSPPLVPLLSELPGPDAEHRVLVFIVAATGRAHSFRGHGDGGRYYIRLGRQNHEARNGLLLQLLQRKGAREPWDRRVHPEARVEDIDLVALRDLLQRLNLWDASRSVDAYLDPASSVSPMVPSFCIREPLTGRLRPRNFTLLLVGRDPQRFWPEAHAILSAYPDTHRATPHAERTEVFGTLLRQADTLLKRLDAEVVVLMDKTGVAQPNVVKYPRRALHEALINALVHRDYDAFHPVRVTVFVDRVEIGSPGGLPPGVDPEAFQQGRALPVWRNQSLAWFLNKLGLAQAEGQGIATIIHTTAASGCPAPSFQLTADSLVCTLGAHPRSSRPLASAAHAEINRLSDRATRTKRSLLRRARTGVVPLAEWQAALAQVDDAESALRDAAQTDPDAWPPKLVQLYARALRRLRKSVESRLGGAPGE